MKVKVPECENSTGYNAGYYSKVYKDVIDPHTQEQLNKLDNSPSRLKNYAKESHWQCQLVNSLVHRIMNLRLMLAEAKGKPEQI